METRHNQQESWNKCLKNANTVHKDAETKYRKMRLKIELIHDGIIKSNNMKHTCNDFRHAKNQLELAINHLKWAQDGLNDFMDQHPSLRKFD